MNAHIRCFVITALLLMGGVPTALAALQCNGCHGTLIPVDNRPVDASFRNPSSGGFPGNHRTHMDAPASADACSICHPGSSSYTASHRDGLIKVSSRINSSPLTTLYNNTTTSWAQTATPIIGTCSGVNCHFETVTPTWGSDPSLTNCGTCHGAPPSGTASTYLGGAAGSHAKHALSYPGVENCQKCHPNNTTFQHATSAGNRDLAISFAAAPNDGSGSYTGPLNDFLPSQNNGFGNCTATYCHSPGNKSTSYDAPKQAATWGGTLGCTGCHDPVTAPVTGSHYTHAFSFSVPCYKCHAATTATANAISNTANHVNSKVDIAFNNTTTALNGKYNTLAVPMQKTPGTAYATCENVYCHSNGQGAGGTWPPTYSTPVWGNVATGNCGTCHDHGYHASTVNELASGSHSKHMQYTFSAVDNCAVCHYGDGITNPSCDQCHDSNPPYFSDSFSRLHANGGVDVGIVTKFGGTYNGTPKPGDGYSNCTNVYCHSNGTSVAIGGIPANTSTTWGSGGLACSGCHGNPPSYANNSPKKNSHAIHNAYSCNKCHYRTTTNGTSITNSVNHVNKVYDVYSGASAGFTYVYNDGGGTCNTISCHATTNAQWGATACLSCHSVAQGSRAAITGQFGANSHHVQGTITDAHCYQCHWEADSYGMINPLYHGGTAAPGSKVDLVVYGAGTRPTSYTVGTTAVQYHYTTNVNRAGVQNITTHCLGCHSDQNNATNPFGDGRTPKQYAWDGSSVAARYSQAGTTTWGKYAGSPYAAPKNITKAFSAHGNATANNRYWDTTDGVDGNMTGKNSSGAINVQCYDCHNSHGSTAAGITSRYSSATGRQKGAILKDTVAGRGGYNATYKPYSSGSATDKNKRQPGASICLDCHMTQTAGTTPWGYTATFGATQAIQGYWDSPYFGPGLFGSQSRYNTFKNSRGHQGGHFGTSSALSSALSGTINGLCTPCHDPHGVTDNTAMIAAANKQYAVPLLKGTFMTSPYKEDTAPGSTTVTFGGVEDWFGGASYPAYNIDQNTFANWSWVSASRISEDVTKFGGLCLQCHTQSALNPNAGSSNYAWRSMNRIHNTVKGWGGQGANAGNAKHSFTCSKCHTAHNSRLPRLMITNCLDYSHRGRVVSGGVAAAGSGSGSYGGGSGNFPGGGQGSGDDGGGWSGFGGTACHDSTNADGWPNNQIWNNVTLWGRAPTLISPTAVSIGSTTATIGANVASDGGAAITARGTVWGLAANPAGNAAAEGGTTTGVFSHARASITPGAKIYYRGYATNSLGTAYSADGSFYTEPGTQASAVNFTAIGPIGMTVNWTRGNGDGVIVLMRQGSAVNSDPVDGTYTGYTANPAFGSGTQIGTGNYVVYKGTGASVAVTGLTSGATYHLAVYEYKGAVNTSGVDQGTNYKPNPVTGTQATTSPTAPTLASPTATAVSSTTATLGANVTTNGGAAITARGTVWGLAANPVGNAASEGGTTTGVFNHARTSITSGTKIYYRGYATNSVDTAYSPDGSFYTEPSTQASAVTFTSVGDNGMTVNWTRGNGDGVVVLIRQGLAVATDPADGTYTTYTANAAFGSGTAIGSAFVIYKGTDTSVAVTGLSSGSTYHVAVYEYKGSVDTSGVDQGANYKPTPARSSQITDTAPVLASPTATAIGSDTATLGANVSSDGGAAITARGTVWGLASNPVGNAVAEGGTTTGVFNHARTSITSGTKIYYRGYATNSVDTGYSPDGSFYTEPSTQASAVNFTSVGDNGMTVNWTRGNGDGVVVLIRQGSSVATDPADGAYTTYTANAAFGSGTAIGSAYVIYKGTGTSVAVTGLSSGSTYHVAVYEYKGTVDTSGTNQGANYKSTAATGSQVTSGVVPPNPPTLNAVTPCDTDVCSETCQNTLTWNSGGGGDGDDKQYYVELHTTSSFNDAVPVVSGWLGANVTTWAPTVYARTWYWRVKARDSVHVTAVSDWSSTTNWTFTDNYYYDYCACNYCGSCPLVYTWSNSGYNYITDIQGPKIGDAVNSIKKSPQLFKPVHTDLGSVTPDKDNNYKVTIKESLPEIDFFDEVRLLTIDNPEGYEIVTSGGENTYSYGYANPFNIYTIRNPILPKSASDKNGKDILPSVISIDDKPAPASRNETLDFYTFDFGRISHPEYAKLLIDGWSLYGVKRLSPAMTVQPYVEVVDKNGGWVNVKSLGTPSGDLKTMVVDLSNSFLSSDHRIRLHKGVRKNSMWVIDRVRLDDSAPVEFKIKEIRASSAVLRPGGHAITARESVFNRLKASKEELPLINELFSYGRYTRYGDVTTLLSERDDMYVIMRYGDALELKFPVNDLPPKGKIRSFVLKSDLYYKSAKKGNNLVEPMPFHGMSAYPYPASESYPQDDKHREYQERYNTREYKEPLPGMKDLHSLLEPEIAYAGALKAETVKQEVADVALNKLPEHHEVVADGNNSHGMKPAHPVMQQKTLESRNSIWQFFGNFTAKLWLLVSAVLSWLRALVGL